ncbi:gliding motility-associated C-terminal domain-containing protein [Aureitalea marina]|uniref:CARDB domain-containing protein n=2 Tax=Aureitalea marina TaxID=930804 RepID=A0A2S7KQ35_9FLAO|nr:gliding motility-associated C-terminal domain-containing protein [Aureitalea marina]PQB04739.1 hypothetical protein BST85_07405 [Aureitalea marina]
MRLAGIFATILLLIPLTMRGQQVELFTQHNGNYDYLAFGNTLNPAENSDGICEILTESSANFSLLAGQSIIAAYLYWAGSGTGDFEVELNGIPIEAERQFSFNFDSQGTNYEFFGAMAEITTLLQESDTNDYLFTELDLTDVIEPFCANQTNFGGWSVTVVYEDLGLPLNQVAIFDGFEAVSGGNTTLNIELNNLDVLDNIGAKIGFLAWEGDSGLAVDETLRINGAILSNPPLNPANNAFNGTNSFTNSSELYNMDIDVYSIENNIDPGDTQALIQLTSGQDLVLINNIVTVLNTELPDATIEISLRDPIVCGDTDFTLDYTVFNLNSTGELVAKTPIAFYIDDVLVGQAQTLNEIPIDGSESNSIVLDFPADLTELFELRAVVDDDGTGEGLSLELDEDNNEDNLELQQLINPEIIGVIDLEECDLVQTEIFDLTLATAQIDAANDISFHLSFEDADEDERPIENPEEYENISSPQTIWIRVENEQCYLVDSFTITVVFCPYPDATIEVDNQINACRQRDSEIEYTVYNIDGRGPLPSGTPIAFYAEDELIGRSTTINTIPINGSERGFTEVELPMSLPEEFPIRVVVDDDGSGTSTVLELNEENNDFTQVVIFVSIPPIGRLNDLLLCDEGFQSAVFDLTQLNDLVSTDPNDSITYYTSETDAIEGDNWILNPESFSNTSNPQAIYVRLENEICFATAVFEIETEKCPVSVSQGISPNGDNLNDELEIPGLLDIFLDFELDIYSRYGNLVYQGGNEDGFWDGKPNKGLFGNPGTLVPTGTYYYVLKLNDPLYPEPLIGYVYVNY